MNSVIFTLGFIEIRWYSILILLGFVIGFLIVKSSCKKLEIPTSLIYDICFYITIFGIIGARLYYCIFEYEYYSKNLLDIFKIWEGGLAIHGGIIAGLIVLLVYTKKTYASYLTLLDIFAPALVLGQAIGRWGNFFNQEAFGPVTTLSKLRSLHIPQFVIDGMKINGEYHHPTFFYESLGCLIIFLIILIVKSIKKQTHGELSGIYLILYGVLRFFIESLRQDSLMLFNFKIAQIVSIIMIIIGIEILIRTRWKNE